MADSKEIQYRQLFISSDELQYSDHFHGAQVGFEHIEQGQLFFWVQQ